MNPQDGQDGLPISGQKRKEVTAEMRMRNMHTTRAMRTLGLFEEGSSSICDGRISKFYIQKHFTHKYSDKTHFVNKEIMLLVKEK